jgi:ComF family protein
MQYPATRSSCLANWLEILLPTQCGICRRPLRGASICYRCRPALPDLKDLCSRSCQRCFSPFSENSELGECETCKTFPPPTDSIRFVWEYDSLVRDLIRTIKYRPSVSLARLTGKLLCDATPQLFQRTNWDLIIPVPSSQAMFRKRLFHPCIELARPVAQTLKIPLINAIKHNNKRAPQASLSHKERLKRLEKIFRLAKRFNVHDKRILLIEDVITTGATIAAATSILKQAGASRVDVLAVARTRVWSRFRSQLHEVISDSFGF